MGAWAFEHGVVFAACAFIDRWGLEARRNGEVRDGRRSKTVRPIDPGKRGVWELPDGALRVRSMLAAATEKQYAEAVERLAERRVSFRQRLLTAYLVPTQHEWVSELCEHPDGVPRDVLFRCLGSIRAARSSRWPGDADRRRLLRAGEPSRAGGRSRPGRRAAPGSRAGRASGLPAEARRSAGGAGRTASNEAFRALLHRRSNLHVSGELMNAMKRFPIRAVRELTAEEETDLLEGHVRGNLEVIRAALPALAGGAREAVERVIAGLDETAYADPADLPGVLTDPPWARQRQKPEPVVITGLSAPEPSLVWAEDERERENWCPWMVPVPYGWSHEGEVRGPWDERIADIEAGRLAGYGRRRAALPKPGAKDDPALAPAAHAAFTQFKKDVRATMPNQGRRLELAMVTGRRWTPREFRELLVDHPLMWHIVRRLVWLAETDTAVTAFRLAEDRTLADVHDEELTPPDTARIGVAHPLTLGDMLNAWSQTFADYEITQPFPQLGRDLRLTEQERSATRLTRFENRTAPWGKVVGLERRGWQRGTPMDNGTERWISRPTPGGLHVVIGLDPGIQVGWGDGNDDQVLRTVWLADEPDDFSGWDTGSHHRFGELDEVTASEVVAELESVTTP